MKVSLIITTYKWHEALDLCLKAVSLQTQMPEQIIICDDGSGEETRAVVEQWKQTLPIVHAWHEDRGFRAAECRNLGLREVTSDYVVSIDGDMVVHEDFIRDHATFAKKGTFVQGSRVLLDKEFTHKSTASVSDWGWDLETIKDGAFGNKKNLVRSRFLNWLIGLSSKKSAKNTRTCNMAFWLDDLKAVNGFDNNYVGWGREDSDLAYRLVNYGCKKRKLKFAAVALHLYHDENARDALPDNDKRLQRVINDSSYYRCENGILTHE